LIAVHQPAAGQLLGRTRGQRIDAGSGPVHRDDHDPVRIGHRAVDTPPGGTDRYLNALEVELARTISFFLANRGRDPALDSRITRWAPQVDDLALALRREPDPEAAGSQGRVDPRRDHDGRAPALLVRLRDAASHASDQRHRR